MDQICKELERTLSSSIIDISQSASGTISNGRLIRLENGQKFFLKLQNGNDMACKREGEGLQIIAKTKTIRTPEVVKVSDHYLLTEYISPGPIDNANYSKLGERLAKLHLNKSDKWGLDNNNFIGTTMQINTECRDLAWSEFFLQTRLGPQIFWLRKKHIWPSEFEKYEDRLVDSIRARLKNITMKDCSLLHGDLWSGNVIWDKNGDPVIIDPAIYYGHREADLALAVLFGGFSDEFFRAYDNILPRQEGHEARTPVYILYHLLNHVNIFGPSYLLQTQKIIEQMI